MPYAHKTGERDQVLAELIEKYGSAEIARRINAEVKADVLTRQAVHLWPRVPERWVEKVAQLFDKSLHELRPDLYARNGRRVYDRGADAAPLASVSPS